MVKLQIKDDAGRTTTVPLSRDEYTVGRKEGNSIRLTEQNVSRTHARFVKRGDEVHVEDLSRYGTRVNGERISAPRRISDGDIVQIGDYQIQLEGAAKALDAPAAPAAPAAEPSEVQAPEVPLSPEKAEKKEALDRAAKARIAAAKAESAETQAESTTSVAAMPGEDEQRKGLGKGRKRLEADHPMLVAVTSSLAGTAYPIINDTTIIGRTGENDLQIEHHSISRNHAKIIVTAGRVKMVDLQSKNGIRVNGEFWEESVLKSGDIIELGKVQFRFVEKGEDFIYRPEDWTGTVAASAEKDEPAKKGGKGWIFLLLLLLAGGAIAVYVLTQKPPEVSNVTTGAGSATVAPKPGPEQVAPAETQPAPAPVPEVTKQDSAQAITEALDKAKAAMSAEKWDDAEHHLQAVLALDKENPQGVRMKAKLATERNAATALRAAQDAQGRNDLEAAWTELLKVKDLPQDSAYYARIQEIWKAVGETLSNKRLDEGKSALARKDYDKALALGGEAKVMYAQNVDVDGFIEDVKKAKAAADKAARDKLVAEREAADKAAGKTTAKGTDKTPTKGATSDTGSKSAKDLYQEARELHTARDLNGALTLYRQAATKGYSKAWRQIGIIEIANGNTTEAINAWKKYVSLNPGAADVEQVKETIVRYGGSN